MRAESTGAGGWRRLAVRRSAARHLLVAISATCGAAPAWADGDVAAPPAIAAPTDTLLPRVGLDPGQDDPRAHLLDAFGQSAPPAPGNTGPALTWTPQLTVSEEYTDNAGQLAGTAGIVRSSGGGTDFVTRIQPSISVQDQTERLTANLTYAPTAEIYVNNGDFSQFREQADGNAVATLLPDLLYFDLRGSISQQAVFGGIGPQSTANLSPNNRETVSSFSASPYVTRTLGGTGTAQAGVAFLYTATDAPNTLNQGGANPLLAALSNNYGSSYLATKRAFASFTTGEDFGRFRDRIGTDTNFYDGSGALRGARRILVTDDVSYAVSRLISVLGEIGYENLDYPQGGYRYVGGIWSAGVALTPTRESSLTLEYRHIDGFGSPYVQGSYQVLPRLRVFGGYSEGISSFDQDQQNALLSGQTDATGARASALLAAPLLDASNSAGANQALNHVRRLDVNASFIADRDVVTAGVQQERSSLVSNTLGLPQSALARYGITNAQLAQYGLLLNQTTKSLTGSVSWRHDLRPDLSATTYAQYSSSQTALTQTQNIKSVSVGVGVDKTFTNTLSGFARYAGTYELSGNNAVVSGPFGNFNYGDATTFTIGVSKRF